MQMAKIKESFEFIHESTKLKLIQSSKSGVGDNYNQRGLEYCIYENEVYMIDKINTTYVQ